jgi:hypothetical protein
MPVLQPRNDDFALPPITTSGPRGRLQGRSRSYSSPKPAGQPVSQAPNHPRWPSPGLLTSGQASNLLPKLLDQSSTDPAKLVLVVGAGGLFGCVPALQRQLGKDQLAPICFPVGQPIHGPSHGRPIHSASRYARCPLGQTPLHTISSWFSGLRTPGVLPNSRARRRMVEQ